MSATGEEGWGRRTRRNRRRRGENTTERPRVGGLAAGSADSENDRGVSRIKEGRGSGRRGGEGGGKIRNSSREERRGKERNKR